MQCLSNTARQVVPYPQNRRVNSHIFLGLQMAAWKWDLGFCGLTVKLLYNISIIYIYLGYSFGTLSVMISAG